MTKGLGIIAGIVVLTIVAWAVTPAGGIPTLAAVAQLCGALGLVGLAYGYVLSTRLPGVTGLYGGAGRTMSVHKWLGISSLGIVVVHATLLILALILKDFKVDTGLDALHRAGAACFTLLVILVLLALLGRKLDHRRWLFLHHFMILPYVIGLAHYYGTSTYSPLGLNPFAVWMDLATLVGLSAAVYALVVRRRTPTQVR